MNESPDFDEIWRSMRRLRRATVALGCGSFTMTVLALHGGWGPLSAALLLTNTAIAFFGALRGADVEHRSRRHWDR